MSPTSTAPTRSCPASAGVEVFGSDSAINRHFTTGPVAGFLVDDGGNGWVHFRVPDGNIYELTQDTGVARPH